VDTALQGFSRVGTSEAAKILLVLSLSFLLGLERSSQRRPTHYVFGGVRTFPLIGFLGYAVALLSGNEILPVAIGLAVVAAFLLLAYRHKLAQSDEAGITTELTGLATYVLGALVAHGYLWIATALVVVSALLLELKDGIAALTKRIPNDEIITFTKFLLLTAVILPVVPNQEFSAFQFNPYKTWLIVVAVSGVSYGSYVLSKVTHDKGGIVLAALLGGAYSSTVMTVVLARRSRREQHPNLFAGSMLVACGMMYIRLTVLLAAFSAPLFALLAKPFLALAGLAIVGGYLWTRVPGTGGEAPKREHDPRNPLEMRSAFFFAALFVVMLIATRSAANHFGAKGLYALAAFMGVADVDPFIMGMTQTAGLSTPLAIAATAIVLTVVANNVAKGVYAFMFADRKTGLRGLLGLLGLAVCGAVPVLLFV
jgi:uncharacterized membrane protein (DUF4010 family)